MMEKITSREHWQSFLDRVQLDGEKPVFIVHSASFCGPCKRIKPMLDRLAFDVKDLAHFVLVMGDDEWASVVTETFNVAAYPTFDSFFANKAVGRVTGTNMDGITNLINHSIGLAATSLAASEKQSTPQTLVKDEDF